MWLPAGEALHEELENKPGLSSLPGSRRRRSRARSDLRTGRPIVARTRRGGPRHNAHLGKLR